ncbi:reverse transcriptase-rnase h-integrase [Moniliophthora roreri MCA 2997]|uniref:Reverse transcriptase-rnase h-integrase n=1 Tax=Moniliophthora roreri (strain MCA 2997) TaxID=1381753 RepID=V2WV15_MONRO|nr:reverse transcriptase-rnase h-integrase [Moniliophthora roreri MCA 2997]
MASPFFFVAKKEKGVLRPMQDYRELNKGMVKNAYPLPLILELLDKLKGANVFTKLDLRNGYNNVRIKDGDKWKATFKTNWGLFEPTIMFFGLSNLPATFQAFMNDILSNFIDEGWKHDLYFKPEKYEFNVTEVIFLGMASLKDDKTPPQMEQQIEQDIAKAEERQRGLLTQSISNPGGRAIPPLTRASRKELLTPLHSPSLTSQPLTETPADDPEIRRTLTPSSTPVGLKLSEYEEQFSLTTPKPSDSATSNTSTNSPEELDPFQRLLQGLKNSLRSPEVQPEVMAEDKKPSGSRPKREEPAVEEAVIGSAMPVQVVSAVKEVKATRLRAFTGARKEARRFLSKKLFLLFYMTDGPGEFWKNNKTDLLLAFDPEAEKVTWADFLEDFKTSFKPLDPALKAQLELKDLRMTDRADEYTYQFTYLAKQTGYNDATQIVAFKRGLPRSLALKIMTRPEGAPTTIKEWMNTAILFDESYKQAQEYGKTWDEEHRGKKPQRNFRKKEEVAIKQVSDFNRKEYMAKGLCFRCGRNGHRIKDCPDMPKKDERKHEEPKKLSKEERFAKIQALVNDQTDEEKKLLLNLMEKEGF